MKITQTPEQEMDISFILNACEAVNADVSSVLFIVFGENFDKPLIDLSAKQRDLVIEHLAKVLAIREQNFSPTNHVL
jgi:hypothetical protein